MMDQELSERAFNCLWRYFDRDFSWEDILSLVNKGELKKVRYLGVKGQAEVMQKLQSRIRAVGESDPR